ncbi:dynamin family protein [Lysinibacillus sp. BW-2-10]|uniref:dynamin family protein n=1 Tax=Lysinibacillus sp. BW-2-10 TaxID=2590030 RepID=UPI00117C6A47|nr:dynamin family protein [Lysinibacillus sp. BW-2-10]TSI05125.1 hypothetical protein FJQ64_12470 [Lysinibacillus sp. BW-2-10]
MNIEQILQLPLNDADRNIITSISQQLAKKEVVIGLFGSFSVGKSELINKLIHHDNLLPTHVNETTAIPTHISAGREENVVLVSKSGERQMIDKEQLHSYVVGSTADIIDRIEISLPRPTWLNSVQFIDTPGRNTKFKSHIESSESAMLHADAVLYVMPWQGLTMEDIVYIKKILVYQPNISFVINKVDRIDESEGISIEDLKEKVASDIEEQLGKAYPVFAVSAKTGFNIDHLYNNFILHIVNNVEKIKKKRFKHSVDQFLQRQKDTIENEITFLQLALSNDEVKLDDEKQKVQLEYSKVETQIAKELSQTQQLLKENELDMDRILNEEMSKLTKEVEKVIQNHQNASVEQLELLLENVLASSRQSIVSVVTARLAKVLGKDLSFHLAPLETAELSLNYSEMSYDELSQQFERQKQQLVRKFESKSDQLKNLPQHATEEERARLTEELQELAELAAEQYVPKIIKDETHDPRKAEKILRGVGFVGDIALAVGLAMATAGVSAGAQVSGKVAAKEGAKIAGKEAAKKAAEEAAKKAAKEAALKAAKEKIKQEVVEKGLILATGGGNVPNDELSKMKKGEQSPLQTAIKTLDMVTSPIETLAVKIGKSIDGNRAPMETEDIEHRNQFFTKKYEIERQYQERVNTLSQLEQQAKENEAIRVQYERKLENLQTDLQNQLQQLEKQREETLQQQQKKHYQTQILQQVTEILEEEKANYREWIQTEFARIYQTVETMLPEHYYGELATWEEKLNEVEQMKRHQSQDVTVKMEEMRAHLEKCESLLESVYEVETL